MQTCNRHAHTCSPMRISVSLVSESEYGSSELSRLIALASLKDFMDLVRPDWLKHHTQAKVSQTHKTKQYAFNLNLNNLIKITFQNLTNHKKYSSIKKIIR